MGHPWVWVDSGFLSSGVVGGWGGSLMGGTGGSAAGIRVAIIFWSWGQ